MRPEERCPFTPEQLAELDAGFARILADREARAWQTAIRAALPDLVQAAVEAVDREASRDDA